MVSIIVPVYNKEKYLRDCVDSILQQTYKDFELILVDDGSKDSSWNIIKEYANKDKRVVPVHQENAGVSAARNAGLDRAQGKWICFVDADDYLPKDSIQILIEHGEKSNADLVNGNAIKIDNGNTQILFKIKNEIITGNVCERLVQNAPWALLFKRSLIVKYKIRFVRGLAYSEDNVFIVNYSLYASSIEFIDKNVYYYRMNPDSVIKSKSYERTAYHQFWAAFEVYKLRDIKKEHYAFIIKRTKNLIGAGINAYIIKSVDIVHLRTLIKLYRSFFNKAMSFDCSFFSQIFIRMVKLTLKFKWY